MVIACWISVSLQQSAYQRQPDCQQITADNCRWLGLKYVGFPAQIKNPDSTSFGIGDPTRQRYGRQSR